MLTVTVRRRLGTFLLDAAFATEHRRIVLFGPSGAGKSLTLHCVAGFIVPDRGHIEIDGTVLFDDARRINIPPWQRRVGMVLQSYTLLPHLSVRQNVAYGLPPAWRGRERARVEMLVAAVGLAGYEDRMPAQLSGGQRQRVVLAQALASEPRLLALDEPFSSVDAPVRERLRRDLLKFLDVFDVPLVFVTHDFEEAFLLGQTVVILAGGRVLQVGLPADISQHPRTATVARLVGATNILQGQVADVSGDTLTLRAGGLFVRASQAIRRVGESVTFSIRPEGIRLKPASPGEIAATVTGALPRNGAATVFLTAGGLTLEATVPGTPPVVGSRLGLEIANGAVQVLVDEEGAGVE